ncbi:hypothetical protein X975_06819, partial [Stegodyphus mimosarum]
MYLIGAVIFLLFGSAEVQSWGSSSTAESSESKTERTLSMKESNLVFTVPVIFHSIGDDSLKKNETTILEITRF